MRWILATALCAAALLPNPVWAQNTQSQTAPQQGPTGFPVGAGAWIAPPGTSISIDRATGRASFSLPTQPVDGSREQVARYAAWRRHPYPGDGPYPSTREEPAAFPKHTLYYPADLAHAPKLPIILWANGGCRNTSVEFTRFLGEIASYGYVVAAIGRSDIPFEIINIGAPLGAGEASSDPRPRQDMNPADMVLALDELARENARPGSKFYQKLDLTHVAAMGQSCGGFQAFQAAKDPRITAVAALNSNFPTRGGPSIPLANADPTWTADQLKIPAAFFTGGPADLAYVAAGASYDAVSGVAPVIKVDMPAMGHTGAYPMPDVRFTHAVVAWLFWVLKDDMRARGVFVGPNCGLCDDPDFWIETKGAG